jgi:hypothetical protein
MFSPDSAWYFEPMSDNNNIAIKNPDEWKTGGET